MKQYGLLKGCALVVAQPFTPEQILRIEKRFSEKLGREIHFDVTIDPDIIGGFVATVDGIMYDCSCMGQLDEISRHLKE